MHLYEFSQVLNDSINGVELTKSCQDVFCALVDCSITYYLWKRSDDKGVAISLKKPHKNAINCYFLLHKQTTNVFYFKLIQPLQPT